MIAAIAGTAAGVALIACGPPAAAPTPKPTEPAIAATKEPTPPPPAMAASRAHLAPTAKGKEVTLEKAPEAARKAFWAAIAEGRKKTASKDYEGAIAAFDRALAAIAEHPRALSGRGYAELLAGRLDAAETDLRRALAAPGTRPLESAIVFNLGLVAERRGELEVARGYFALANTLSPSKAAAKKLAGAAPACPVEVQAPGAESELFATWTEVWKKLAGEGLVDAETAPTTEAAAKAIVCTSEPLSDGDTGTFDACAGAPGGPWVTRRYYEFGGIALVAFEPGDSGQIRMTDLGMAGGGRCGAGSVVRVVRSDRGDGAVVHWEITEYAPIDVMEDKDGQIVDCVGDHECFTACGDDVDASALDYVFSSRTADPTLVRGPLDERGEPVVAVTIEGQEIVIKGAGCDQRRPLAP